MSAERTDYHPVKFLDGLEGYNHTVLLYDKQEYGDLIIARYFLNGLKKGESCIFFTSDAAEGVERRLSAAGVDVEIIANLSHQAAGQGKQRPPRHPEGDQEGRDERDEAAVQVRREDDNGH